MHFPGALLQAAQTAPFPVSPLSLGLVIAVIVSTIFVWAWAVRRPVPVNPPTQTGQEEEAQTMPRPFVYAAIGASDVVGIGATDPENDNWASRLARHLPPGTQLVKLGRGGITLNEANKLEVPQAVSAQPDLVTMWNCVNDAVHAIPLALYLRDLRTALDRLTEDTKAQIVLLNLPDLSLLVPAFDPARRALVQGGIRQWNTGMADVAAKYRDRVTLVDLFPTSDHVLAQPGLISMDNFHPSSEGYRWIAEYVWEAIEREGLPGSTRRRGEG